MVKKVWLFLRHVFSTTRRARSLFPPEEIAALERSIASAEAICSAQIKLIVENGIVPRSFSIPDSRTRAKELFSYFEVWDTENNNGVLLYIELVEHSIEIIPDRNAAGPLSDEILNRALIDIQQGFYQRTPGMGIGNAIRRISEALAVNFPPSQSIAKNEVPNKIEFV